MDKNVNSFDALYAEIGGARPLMSWDELLGFVRRFPHIAAFNAALIAQQRAGAIFVETEQAWRTKYNRLLTNDASALIVLHPFAPVRFVYDIADTVGTPVPAEVINPFTSTRAPTWDGLRTVMDVLGRHELTPTDLPRTQSPTVMLERLLFELALTFAGHRGSRPDLGIAGSETDIDGRQARFEAECITWVIAGRLGLKVTAAGSLKRYLKHGELMPPVSRDRVLHSVNAVEKLFGGALSFAEIVREDVPSLFSMDGEFSLPS